jgi:hypothetical protein
LGAAFGIKTYFKASQEWELISSSQSPKEIILDRCIFKHRREKVLLIADAYEGSHIREAVTDFLSAAAGLNVESLAVTFNLQGRSISFGAGRDLVAYVGHDAFMDFQIPLILGHKGNRSRAAIVFGVREQALLCVVPQGGRRSVPVVDDRADGSGSLHAESRARWVDFR